MYKVYLAFGSNLGDRKKIILTAIDKLLQKGLILHKISSLYETVPYGYTEQPIFLNCVGSFLFGKTSYDLLEITQGIENELGRKRTIKWGPRNIDIDILLFAEQVMNKDDLTIPHYDIQNRMFFLIPLTEINPDIEDPRNGLKYTEYMKRLMDSDVDSIKLFTDKETLLFELEKLSEHYI
jgi:2-amino-4-hydroxy-6-hydroxymethyldihydropteridine diphosphokinase